LHRKRGWTLIPALVTGWLIVVMVGMGILWRHELTPGPVERVRSNWPVNLSFDRNAAGYTLVMTVHPECPCTRASVDELATLMTSCQSRVKAVVLVAALTGPDEKTKSSGLWELASQIPGVTCVADRDAVMTARFGAETSGQVYLYDVDGVLQFSGGITAARGHEGDNDGVAAICSIVNTGQPLLKTTPVYGCRIR
jgi:hypothetical protein